MKSIVSLALLFGAYGFSAQAMLSRPELEENYNRYFGAVVQQKRPVKTVSRKETAKNRTQLLKTQRMQKETRNRGLY